MKASGESSLGLAGSLGGGRRGFLRMREGSRWPWEKGGPDRRVFPEVQLGEGPRVLGDAGGGLKNEGTNWGVQDYQWEIRVEPVLGPGGSKAPGAEGFLALR